MSIFQGIQLTPYDISLPLPMPMVNTIHRSPSRILTIDLAQEWPLTSKEIAESQCILVSYSSAYVTNPVITLDTAANLIPYFPNVHTGSMYSIIFTCVSSVNTDFTVRGCTGSYLLGVTGAVDCSRYLSTSVHLRWDNVSGSTGSYTIM